VPIVDIEYVRLEAHTLSPAPALASALGRVFGSPPGRTWVRVRHLNSGDYAENDVAPDPAQLPVFVTMLLAQPPGGEALEVQVRQVTEAVAGCLSVAPDRVHVQYAPPAAGRQAFGGELLR
jgi:phenylpyruvate tautomerase PptA (4-oxalocrotonate tautomerase family)